MTTIGYFHRNIIPRLRLWCCFCIHPALLVHGTALGDGAFGTIGTFGFSNLIWHVTKRASLKMWLPNVEAWNIPLTVLTRSVVSECGATHRFFLGWFLGFRLLLYSAFGSLLG